MTFGTAFAVTSQKVQIVPNQWLTPCQYAGVKIALIVNYPRFGNTPIQNMQPFLDLKNNPYLEGVNLDGYLNWAIQAKQNGTEAGQINTRITNDCIANYEN